MDNQKNKGHVAPCRTWAERCSLFSFDQIKLEVFSDHDNESTVGMIILGVLFFNGKEFVLSKNKNERGQAQYWFHEILDYENELSAVYIPVVFEGLLPLGMYLEHVRFVTHQDGWIYMCFTISVDIYLSKNNTCKGVRKGVLRSRDVFTWDALPFIITDFDDHDDIIIHPHFIDNGYGFFTIPLIERYSSRNSCNVAFGISAMVDPAHISAELVFNEFKTGTIVGKYCFGPAPLSTALGWLQMIQYFVETDQGTKLVSEVFITDPHLVFKLVVKPKKCLIKLPDINQDLSLAVMPSCTAWKMSAKGELIVYMINIFGRLEISKILFSDFVAALKSECDNAEGKPGI